MTSRRFGERPRTRKAGAGRPRSTGRKAKGPVDEEILGAAARLFAKKGVGATTMADIAEEVGMAVSSIYYYFRNKHDVLERIVVDLNRAPLAVAEQVILDHADSPARLHAFILGDVEVLCGFPFDINEIHRLAGEEPETFERYWADREQLLARVARFVSDGIGEGLFMEVNPELAAVTILANDEAVQNWYRPPGSRPSHASTAARFSVAEVSRYQADLALRGLLVEPDRLAKIAARTSPSP